MKIKFFENNEYIFTISIDESSNMALNIMGSFPLTYNVLGEYSNQLKNDLKYWHNLAKRAFETNNDIIFCSKNEKFLILLEANKKKNLFKDESFFKFDFVKDDNNIKAEIPNKESLNKGFISIVEKIKKRDVSRRSEVKLRYEKVLKYNILEIILTQDASALLLSFIITSTFFLFSSKCINYTYNFLVKGLMTNENLKKVLELGENKNYIYENIIKYQDLIYNTILDSLGQPHLLSNAYKLVSKSGNLITLEIIDEIGYDIVKYYEKYYLSKGDMSSFESKKYFILADKILNKKSKF